MMSEQVTFPTESDHTYTLIYGNAEAIAPNYDLHSFIAEIETQIKGEGILGTEAKGEYTPAKDKRTDTIEEELVFGVVKPKVLFDVMVVLVSVILVWVGLKAMAKNKNENDA